MNIYLPMPKKRKLLPILTLSIFTLIDVNFEFKCNYFLNVH